MASTYGKAAKKARLDKNVSMYELSKLTGIHENTIYLFERGITMPTISTVDKLASALGMSIDEYIGKHTE